MDFDYDSGLISNVLVLDPLTSALTVSGTQGIEIASLDDPAAPIQNRQLAATFRALQADVFASTFIDLSRADTIAGVTAFETYGVIAAGRAQQILTAPVTVTEIPLTI